MISEHLKIFVTDIEKIPLDSATVIHYGFETASSGKIRNSEGRHLLLGKLREVNLIAVGRLIDQKGHSYLLEAMHELSLNGNNVKLTIVGDGPLRINLEKMSKSLGIENIVDFVGWQNNVNYYYQSADIAIHPSLWEGFGQVLLEAMHSRLPIIASKVSAIPEIVEDSITGILVAPADSSALAEAIY